MIGIELDVAIDRVRDALEVQGKQRKLDMVQLRRAIELWESLRPEAVLTVVDENDFVRVEELTEDSQVRLYERAVRVGNSLTAFSLGFFEDKIGSVLTVEQVDEYADAMRIHARAKIGTDMGFAMLRAIEIRTQDVFRGVTQIDPKRFAVALVEGSIVAEPEFTPEEERIRRARWILRYVIATQSDREMHENTLELDDLEMEYVTSMVKQIELGIPPEQEDMEFLGYFMQKLQPNNRLFGTTAGLEELWIGQVRQILCFLADFSRFDHSALDEVEVRMVEQIRENVSGLLASVTLGGALHDIADDQCKVCGMVATEARDRLLCQADARDTLERLLPLGALPDLYRVKAKLLRAGLEGAR